MDQRGALAICMNLYEYGTSSEPVSETSLVSNDKGETWIWIADLSFRDRGLNEGDILGGGYYIHPST